MACMLPWLSDLSRACFFPVIFYYSCCGRHVYVRPAEIITNIIVSRPSVWSSFITSIHFDRLDLVSVLEQRAPPRL